MRAPRWTVAMVAVALLLAGFAAGMGYVGGQDDERVERLQEAQASQQERLQETEARVAALETRIPERQDGGGPSPGGARAEDAGGFHIFWAAAFVAVAGLGLYALLGRRGALAERIREAFPPEMARVARPMARGGRGPGGNG